MSHRSPKSSLWLRFLNLIIVTTNLLSGYSVFAQQADKFVLEGPQLENCDVTFRYYKSRLIAKAISIKVSLIDGRLEEAIEPGFDGFEVFVQSRVAPVKATILAGKDVAATEQLEEPGKLQVTTGKIGRVEYTPDSIDPDKGDLAAVESHNNPKNPQATTAPLVLESDVAEIDFQCLDVFSRAIHEQIGAIDYEKTVEGMIAWKENNQRALAGVLYGKDGLCGFRATLVGNKFADLQPNCPSLPDTYFVEPLNTELYVQQAEKLTRFLFEGNAEAAHKLYARRFQEQVKVQQLAKLSTTLKERYGEKVRSVKLKRTNLLAYDFARRSRSLQVDCILETNSSRCVSRVVFNIACDRNRVGKADLGAVNVTPVFSSSSPLAAKLVHELLEGIGNSDVTYKRILSSLPSELAAITDHDELQGLTQRLAERFAGQKLAIDFDLWQVSQFQNRTHASGELKFGDKDCYAEFQFVAGEKLIGFSFYGPSVAESTMSDFKFPAAIADTAQNFWTRLLKEEADLAHAMLDKDFQSQFSLEDLRKQLAEPELRPSKLKQVTVDSVRMSNQVARPQDLMATAFLTAEFEDGQVTQVACDLGLPTAEDASLAVFDFTNEFEIDFPVTRIPKADSTHDNGELVIAAFQANDFSKLLDLVDPARQTIVDKSALAAYFKNLRSLLAPDAPSAIARTVEYQVGSKRYRCNFDLKCETGESLPIEAWFYRGYLERFVVSHPKINDFVDQMEDKTEVSARVNKFVEGWFGEMNEARAYMVSSIQNAASFGALKSLKEEFEAQHGKLKSQKIVSQSVGEQAGELEFTVTLEGEQGSKTAKILVDLGAFGGLVSAVTIP